jgi:CRISPR-associated protein Cas2
MSTNSKFRMAWVLVLFDLPVGSDEERKAAMRFRNDLLDDGFEMLQFSVYARPCGSPSRVDSAVSRMSAIVPKTGHVRLLVITDAQWSRTIIVENNRKSSGEDMPEQMRFL